MSLIADSTHNAASWAAQFRRRDETVLAWVHAYSQKGPEALTYRRTGSRAPLFAADQAQQLVDTLTHTEPIAHGLPGHGWTLKKLRQWVLDSFGRSLSRNAIRRVLHNARLSWKKIKKLLGKAKADQRAEHVARLQELFKAVCRDEITLIYLDESHFHHDLDLGFRWSRRGERA